MSDKLLGRMTRQERRKAEQAKRDAEAVEHARTEIRIDEAASAAVQVLPGDVGPAVAALLEAMKPWRASDGHMSFSMIGRSSPEVLALAEAVLAEAAPLPAALARNHRENADYNAVMNGVARALSREGLTWEQIDEVTDACLTYVENHHSVCCPDGMCPCSYVGDNAERDLIQHYLRTHAPISAEDIRAAERAWHLTPLNQRDPLTNGRAAFVADYLNRRQR